MRTAELGSGRAAPRRGLGLAALVLGLLFLPCPSGGAEESTQERQPSVMAELIRRFAADEASLRQFYPEPLSAGRSERLTRFLARWQGQLGSVDPKTLDLAGQVDHALLLNHLGRRADELALQEARRAELLPVLPFAADLIDLEAARRRLEAVEPAAAATQLSSLDAIVRAAQASMQAEDAKARPAAVVAFRAAKAIARLRGILRGWFTHRDGYEPAFGWWVRKPYRALDKSLADYGTFLRQEVAGVKQEGPAPLIGDPIGRRALRRALARELIPYTPEQLLSIAWEELHWCEARGREAGAELGVKGGWPEIIEHVKGLHQPPGKQDDLVARQAREAIAFLKERDLVHVPPLCEETWRLEMISQQGQETLPFAVYNDQAMFVAYAMEDMDHDAKLMSMRGNNEHFTRIVTPHELIPGHHLQLFVAERTRAYRALFRTPFLVEGWALHWEMLLWDKGWARNAADRVGMLFWRMHRCARIIVTLGFHLGQMQPGAMVDFLAQRVGLERDGATSEVRRYVAGAYGPLYQCAYMLGGLQMRALHTELVGGGKMSDRVFHDRVLAENSIPIALIRYALRADASAEHPAGWLFRGEVKPYVAPSRAK